METDAIHWSGGQPITAPGGTVPCSRAPRPWRGGGLPPLQLSVHQSLSGESGNQTANKALSPSHAIHILSYHTAEKQLVDGDTQSLTVGKDLMLSVFITQM